jgi:phosphoribosylcarboxyaminoimidazole (NCAIR) mutase
VCQDELTALARAIGDLGVHMLGGGHCNELFAEAVNDIVLLAGGSHMGSYARAIFQFDTAADTVVDVNYGVQMNTGGTADPTITAIINEWQAKTDAELNLVIGYTTAGLAQRSPEMQALTTESWLIAYPAADAAITNLGAMSGVVAAPCGAPAFAVALTWVAAEGAGLMGFVYLFVFSLGMTSLLIAVGLFSGTLALLPRSGVWMLWVKRIAGLIMIGVAEYYFVQAGYNL